MKKLLSTLLITSTILTGCASKNQTSNVEAETSDTTKPVITLKGETVNVVLGKDYEAKDNVKSVTDDTDGTLKYAEKATKDEAYYIVEDKDVDTSKEGTYKVKVSASDKAGNVAEKEFSVVVTKEDTDEKKSESKETTNSKSTDKKDTASTSKASSEKKSTSSSSSISKKTTTSNKSNSSTSSSKKTTSTTTSNSNSTASSSTSSNSSNSGSTSSNSSSSSQTDTTTNSQPVHEHSWVAITETVHHDEVGHWDKEAQYGILNICRGCGKVFYSDAEVTAHIASVTQEQFLAGCGAMKQETGIVGYTDVWKVDKEAYDESVITGYKCSTCGETK